MITNDDVRAALDAAGLDWHSPWVDLQDELVELASGRRPHWTLDACIEWADGVISINAKPRMALRAAPPPHRPPPTTRTRP